MGAFGSPFPSVHRTERRAICVPYTVANGFGQDCHFVRRAVAHSVVTIQYSVFKEHFATHREFQRTLCTHAVAYGRISISLWKAFPFTQVPCGALLVAMLLSAVHHYGD